MINIIFPIVLLVVFLTTLMLTLTQFAFASVFGTITILLSLAYALYSIFQKHKDSKNPRNKIAKELLKFIAVLLIISFLSGVAGLFINFYIGNLFGVTAGFVCAILLSFIIGYLVRKGIAKLSA